MPEGCWHRQRCCRQLCPRRCTYHRWSMYRDLSPNAHTTSPRCHEGTKRTHCRPVQRHVALHRVFFLSGWKPCSVIHLIVTSLSLSRVGGSLSWHARHGDKGDTSHPPLSRVDTVDSAQYCTSTVRALHEYSYECKQKLGKCFPRSTQSTYEYEYFTYEYIRVQHLWEVLRRCARRYE